MSRGGPTQRAYVSLHSAYNATRLAYTCRKAKRASISLLNQQIPGESSIGCAEKPKRPPRKGWERVPRMQPHHSSSDDSTTTPMYTVGTPHVSVCPCVVADLRREANKNGGNGGEGATHTASNVQQTHHMVHQNPLNGGIGNSHACYHHAPSLW